GGNNGDTFPVNLQIDAQGNVWVGGTTQGGSNFPITQGAFQTTFKSSGSSGYNSHLTEYSSDGTQLLYGTYLGGGGSDSIQYFAFDALGNIYLTGDTSSTNYPISATAYEPRFANGDVSPDRNDIFFTILGVGVIGAVSPTTGYNTGDTTVTLSGLGFQQGASCALVSGGATIAATSVSIASNGTSMSCTFALAGVATGSYDIVVTQPGGGARLDDHGAFTVDSGSGQSSAQTKVWSTLAGRPAIRVGVPSRLVINYGNTGGLNAYMTVIWVILPSSYTYTLDTIQFPTDPNCAVLNALPLAFSFNGSSYIPVLVPIIAAGSSSSFGITVTAPTQALGQQLAAYAEAPWFDSFTAATQALQNAAASPAASLANACIPNAADPSIDNCFGAVSGEMAPGVASYLAAYSVNDPLVAVDTTVQLANNLLNLLNQSASQGGASFVYPWTTLADQAGIDLLQRLAGTSNQCNTPNLSRLLGRIMIGYKPPPNPPQVVLNCPDDDTLGFGVDFLDDMDPCTDQDDDDDVDPNDKKGPNGDGSASRFLRPLSPFVYTVAFENEATATLPASQVIVTDQLDPTKVNLSTLTLGSITFGTTTIGLPAGANNFSTTYSINSSMSVRIQGSLDSTTGVLKWTFTTIDPSTGLPPTDPTVGFLPPDTDGIKGQASVMFSVMPQTNLSTGTQISNQAVVVFDANAPLSTPTWLNTIDVTSPASSVQSLAATQNITSFPVAWAGNDSGSGVASYSIYVSDNGGPFTQWLNQTAATSAGYAGLPGHAYGFYSIATDHAGNVQPAKTAADATTAVSSTAAPFSLAPPSANMPAVGGNGTVTVTAPAPSAAWPATSNASWITVTSTSPMVGNGTVSYTVASNSGLQRVGTITIAGLTFTVTQAGAINTSGLGFYPVTPCRVADTRNGNGTFGGPIMTGGSTRVFPIPSSACAIPSNALAYSLNITVVPPAALTYLTVWPTGVAQPYVSTLNAFQGQVVANAAIVPAGSNGAISVFVSDTTHVIIDINGYFTTPDANALAFYPLTPCRIADTRAASGFPSGFGPPTMATNTSRSFAVQSSSCGVPATARAYSLNMTAVPPGPLTYLTTWPAGVTQPVVSTLNAFQGQVVANAAIVPAGTSGQVSVYVSNTTDVIIDINGYFAPPGQGALFFYPATPCRVADTRAGTGFSGNFGPPSLAGGSTRNFPITASACAIPSAAQAYSLNMTVVPPGPMFYLTTWPAGLPQPVVSTLNDLQGTTLANAAIVPAGTGPISVFVSDATNLVIDINGYFGQ
ncbi:MAG TPA: BACON domain-containing protein, partial [Verrucomicrobiae bacterium]|nr:BACON domain-containing protein [Verrucomicrobiae bacterium]